jgi:F-type H+-transporting ATPase subunit delta
MSRSEAAETYARSLFDLASLTDSVTDAEEQLQRVASTIRGHVDLRDALADPAVPAEKKRDILREIFGDNVTPAVLSVTQLAVESGHVDMLPEVTRDFSSIVEEELGVIPAQVTTAVPLTDALRSALSAKLDASLGKRVVLREKIDPAIVGGIVIKVAGRVLDASVRKQLVEMRTALSMASAGSEA